LPVHTGKEYFESGRDAQGDASKAIQIREPEKVVVEDPPPDYPRFRVEPGDRASLAATNPDETEHYRKKKDVARELEKQRRRIQALQERLYAENERGMLIVLQAMDTGGKDGTIKHVSSRAWTTRTNAGGSPRMI
jgi:polyphosphate kinase 2 (PPK2 family)